MKAPVVARYPIAGYGAFNVMEPFFFFTRSLESILFLLFANTFRVQRHGGNAKGPRDDPHGMRGRVQTRAPSGMHCLLAYAAQEAVGLASSVLCLLLTARRPPSLNSISAHLLIEGARGSSLIGAHVLLRVQQQIGPTSA